MQTLDLVIILCAAQGAWVAYLRYRGADYVRAQTEDLSDLRQTIIRIGELNLIERMIELQYLSLENRGADLARQQETTRRKPDSPATQAAPTKKAA